MTLCFNKKKKQMKLNRLIQKNNLVFETKPVLLSRIYPQYSIEKKFPTKVNSQNNLVINIYDKLKYTYNQPITRKLLHTLFATNEPIKVIALPLYEQDRFLVVDGNFRIITLFKMYNLLNKRLPSIECQVVEIQNKELSDKIKKMFPVYQIYK